MNVGGNCGRGSKAMVPEKKDERLFLIRLDGDHFYHSLESGGAGRNAVVNSTDVPSAATAFSYEEADQLCRRLRHRGFPMIVVTTIAGKPVTYDDLKQATAC